jgi:hypothetical protein
MAIKIDMGRKAACHMGCVHPGVSAPDQAMEDNDGSVMY